MAKQKRDSHQLTVRLSADVIAGAKMAAMRDHRGLNDQLCWWLTLGLEVFCRIDGGAYDEKRI